MKGIKRIWLWSRKYLFIFLEIIILCAVLQNRRSEYYYRIPIGNNFENLMCICK